MGYFSYLHVMSDMTPGPGDGLSLWEKRTLVFLGLSWISIHGVNTQAWIKNVFFATAIQVDYIKIG